MCVESFEVYSYYVQCGFSTIFIHTSICVYIGIFGRIHKYIKDMGFNVYNKFHWISLLYVEELENFKNLLTSNKICIFLFLRFASLSTEQNVIIAYTLHKKRYHKNELINFLSSSSCLMSWW
jgi:hypothetical protein